MGYHELSLESTTPDGVPFYDGPARKALGCLTCYTLLFTVFLKMLFTVTCPVHTAVSISTKYARAPQFFSYRAQIIVRLLLPLFLNSFDTAI